MANGAERSLRRAVPGLPRGVAPIGLGGWLTLGASLDEAASVRLLRAAVDGGIDLVDLADVYADGAAERVVGKFLREVDRERVTITSKVFWPTSARPEDRGLSRRHIHASIDRTLARLGCAHVDVYFCHREDPATPLAETVRAMGDLVRAGKVRAWGTSCWRPSRLAAAHALAQALGVPGPAVEQPQYSLLERSPEVAVLPACQRLGMTTFVWSPLAGGVLTGKYLGGTPEGSRGSNTGWIDAYRTPRANDAVRRFVAACRCRDMSPAAVSLAWTASQQGVGAALVGASSLAQLVENLAAIALLAQGADLSWAAESFPHSWQRRLRIGAHRLAAAVAARIRY